MKKDKHKTPVLFLIEQDNEFTTPQVMALFTKDYYNLQLYGKTMLTCYAHIGQHSACHIDYAMNCEKAKPSQYKELKKELEGLGYNLSVVKEFEQEADLFDTPEKIPAKVRKVLDKYAFETYIQCKQALKELKKLGYKFDYYLDCTPYNLRKI